MKSVKVVEKAIYVFVFLFFFNATVSFAAVINGISVNGNMDIPGGDYNSIQNVVSVEQCVNFCSGDSRCRAFSYTQSQQTCWLKDRINRSVRTPGVVSGSKLSAPSNPSPAVDPDLRRPMAMEIMRGTDLPGYDFLNFVVPNYKKCAKACDKTDRCKAFTFNKVTKICWLKYRKPNPMKKRGSVSGVKR